MPAYKFESYQPPADGTEESADPNFVPRDRPCGLCGRGFVTSPKFRYYCGRCRGAAIRPRSDTGFTGVLRKRNPARTLD